MSVELEVSNEKVVFDDIREENGPSSNLNEDDQNENLQIEPIHIQKEDVASTTTADQIEETNNVNENSLKVDNKDPMIESTNSNNSLLNDLNLPTATTESSYEQEIARLHNLLSVKENENSNLEQKILDYEQQSKIEIEQLHQNFTLKLDQTLKKFQESQKDKTSSMVMK
jgi:hypothetical protein